MIGLTEYHARPEWSHSQIEVLAQGGPPLFFGTFISKEFPRPQRDALEDGSIVHDVITGGRDIADVVAVIPADVLASGARRGKAWTEWSEANAGRIQRKADEYDALARMVASVRSHPKARWLLDAPGWYERSIAWTDAATSLILRARPDKTAVIDGRCILADLKTTRATNHRTFAADAAKYGYHRQAAWYADGVETGAAYMGAVGMPVDAFVFITVDKTPAHETHVYDLAPSAIALGRQENQTLLAELAYRLRTNDWGPRDQAAILEIDLPAWKYLQPQEWRVNE